MTIPTWLFVGGVVCFIVFFLLPGHPSYVSMLGWTVFSCAYFQVLVQNYKKKEPVPALGRWVEYSKQPGLYNLIYLVMALAGLFTVLAILLISIFSN